MLIEVASFSETGPRSSNQDRLHIPVQFEGRRFLSAIADGVGGSKGGGEAAQIAIDCVREFHGAPLELPSVFDAAVRCYKDAISKDSALADMGTTLSLVLIEDEVASVAHVGDTRVYHLRGAGLNTLTLDQTEVAELLRRGVLTERQAKRYPRRNVLLSALSANGEYNVYRKDAHLQVGDRLLLSTDGFYQRVNRRTIRDISVAHVALNDLVESLRMEAIGAQPSDNFSVIGIEIKQ